MLIQLDWLKEYVDLDIPAEELAEILSMGGLEVESLEWVELPEGGKTQVMELNVTPNRGYCLSYRGVAREVAALLGKPFRFPTPEADLEKVWGETPVSQKITVENREETLCPRYAALVIENVRIGPSPGWLAGRLRAIGLRPINNIVDITNYVMMEYGQPLHAFDGERLAGPAILIRRARENESFQSLDGTDLKLGADALVIADANKPVALAGIMGGTNSEVSDSTVTVVLESACFDPVTVRKGSKKYGLRTDSSYRFERGVDIDGVISAQSRAALLIRELAGGQICRGRIDLYPQPFSSPRIPLRVSRVNQVLGTHLDRQTIQDYLQRLGLTLAETGDTVLQVEVPPFRPTLSREIDLIEEIARLHGFGNVDAAHPRAEILTVRLTRKQNAARQAKSILCHLGFSEAINYSFIEKENAEKFKTAFGSEEAIPISLSNPLSNDWASMRTSLLPGLLKTAARNISKGQKPVKIFELGDVFFREQKGESNVEKTCFAAFAVGPYESSVWKDTGKDYDFFDLKGILETLMSQFKLSLEFRPSGRPFLNREKSVDCLAAGRVVGYLGELSPGLVRQWELSRPGFVWELDFDAVVSCLPEKPRFQPIPKYPETYRDISILVDQSVPSRKVADLILETSAPLIRRVELYDLFEGKKIERGKKSLTFSLSFQSPEKTLTDEEVKPVFDKILQSLSDRLGATLREG
ncbi:MAG: phenylalanine--tRNA ligase subunit beta [Nitrospinaceae bacterium]